MIYGTATTPTIDRKTEHRIMKQHDNRKLREHARIPGSDRRYDRARNVRRLTQSALTALNAGGSALWDRRWDHDTGFHWPQTPSQQLDQESQGLRDTSD